MLGKAKQIKYLKKRWRNIKKYFLLFINSKNADALHKFRVEIKKVDALVFLLSECGKNQKLKKHFKPVKKIFKHAGSIRSAYLNIELIKKYNAVDLNFNDEENKFFLDEINRFVAKSKAYLDTIKKSFQKISKDLTGVRNKCIVHSYRKQMVGVIDFFSKEKNPEDLHAYRKKIKLLLYMHSVLSKAFIRKLQLDTSYLDKLQDTIGKWHDNISAVELFTKDHAGKQVINKLNRQIKRLLSAINSLSLDMEKKMALKP